MAANEYTAKFNIDISDLKKGMQQANQVMRVANSEFKAATGGMDSWGKSADGLSAKLKQLNTVHDAQSAKLELLQAEYDRVSAAEGKNSKGAQDLYVKMNNLKGEIGKTESQIKKYSSALDDVQKEQSQTGSSTQEVVSASEKLKRTISDQESELSRLKSEYASVALSQGKSSKEAKSLGSQIKKLSSELSDNKAKMSDAEGAAERFDKSLDELEDSAKNAGEGFTVMKGALANLVASGIKSFASSMVEGVKSLAGLSQETQEYREDLGKLETAFESAGISTDLATKTYKDFYSVLGEEDRSVEAVNHLAKLVSTEEDMSKWTTIATGVWGTFGDSLPIEGLTEAANETAKTGTVTGVLADALNWAGKSEDDFNTSLESCNSEQERAQLITDTLNELYSDAAKNYQENNASIIEARKATSDYNDTMAELGEKVEPITTKIRQGFTDILQEALKLVNGVDFSAVGAAIDGAFSFFINTIIPAIKDGFSWIIANKDTLIAGFVAIGAAVATAFVANKIISFVGAIKTLVTTVQTAGTVLNVLKLALAALGGPVTIVIGIISALVAAFVYLWNTSEGFRNFWIGLWETVKSAVGVAVDAIAQFFTVTLPEVWNIAITAIGEFITGVVNWFSQLPGQIGAFISQIWTDITTWAANMIAKAIELGSGFLNSVVSFFTQLPGEIWGFITKIWNDIKNWAANMLAKAKELGSNFLSTIVQFFSQLPGKVWGFISNVFSHVVNWASNMWVKARETGSNFLSSIVSFFSQLPGRVWGFLSSVISNVISFVSTMVSNAVQVGSQFLSNIVSFFSQLPGQIWSFLSSAISYAGSFVSDMLSKASEAASGFFNNIVSGLAGLPGEVWNIGSSIVDGIWGGISAGWDWLVSSVSNLAHSLLSAAKSALGINSPSRKFRDIVGKMIPAGIGVGIRKNAKAATGAMRDLSKKLLPEAQKLQSGLGINVPKLPKSGGGSDEVGQRGGNIYQTFNQYNNSPKALSRLEIYRQTRNQLAFAKGV